MSLRAQRRAGEMLVQLDKGHGGRPQKTADNVSEVSEEVSTAGLLRDERSEQ